MGKWPACVAFIVAMQTIALVIALLGWRAPKTALPVQIPGASAEFDAAGDR
jgi:hypothetical protein